MTVHEVLLDIKYTNNSFTWVEEVSCGSKAVDPEESLHRQHIHRHPSIGLIQSRALVHKNVDKKQMYAPVLVIVDETNKDKEGWQLLNS